MSKIRAGRVIARCLECGGEAVTRADGIPPAIEHEVECPERSPQHGYRSWSPEERAEYDAMYDR